MKKPSILKVRKILYVIALRPAFTERVVTILQSHADPGPGDVNGVVRQALIGLWFLPDETELRSSALASRYAGSKRAY